jgi:hypothetical protein
MYNLEMCLGSHASSKISSRTSSTENNSPCWHNFRWYRHDLGCGILLLSVSYYCTCLFIFFIVGMDGLDIIQE